MLLRQHLKEFFNLISGFSIEADKGILYNQNFWLGKQVCCQFVFTQFTARQKNDIFIKQIFEMEQLIDMLLKSPAFGRIFTCHLIGLFQFAANGRRFLINLHLIPSLLEKISSVVVTAIGVTKRDMLNIIIGFREGIFDHSRENRMTTSYHIDEHRLSGSVTADDGNMFSLVE